MHVGVFALCWSLWICGNDMILLTRLEVPLFFRLSTWLDIWVLPFSHRTRGNLWLLDATDYGRLLIIFTDWLARGVLGDIMDSFFMPLFFRWQFFYQPYVILERYNKLVQTFL
jgi:hypothetical protein